MGTTVTPHLSLIKPDINESIQQNLPTFPGWASQNANNMNILDGLFKNTSSTFTLNWTADTVNPTPGSGAIIEGKFARLFPRLVLVYFRINAGTTGFAQGTGVYRLNLPVAAAVDFTSVNDGIPVGKAVFYDSSASATTSAFGVCLNPGAGNVFLQCPTGGAWSATNPVVPAQGDRVSGWYMYPVLAGS